METKRALSWKKSKALRARILGSSCEVCGEAAYMVGHHVNGRLRGKRTCCEEGGVINFLFTFFHNWEICQLRCGNCEMELHMQFPSGNSPLTLKIQEENNQKIKLALEAEEEAKKALFASQSPRFA